MLLGAQTPANSTGCDFYLRYATRGDTLRKSDHEERGPDTIRAELTPKRERQATADRETVNGRFHHRHVQPLALQPLALRIQTQMGRPR